MASKTTCDGACHNDNDNDNKATTTKNCRRPLTTRLFGGAIQLLLLLTTTSGQSRDRDPAVLRSRAFFLLCPSPQGAGHYAIPRSVRLSVPWRSCPRLQARWLPAA